MSPQAYFTWILGLGILAQWLAWRMRIPSILLLLAFGFAFGQITGVRVTDFLANSGSHGSPLLSIVGLLVAIILFEGGLTLKMKEFKESGLPILRLCTLGVALSFVLTTGFMMAVLGYDWRVSAIVGAILTVTGPTVVAPLLRHIKPTRRTASIVKWEGIVVDPIGAILAVIVFKVAIAPGNASAYAHTALALLVMLVTGVVGALLLAKAVVWLLQRHLVPDYLQPVFLLAVVAVAFTGANMVEKETGLLTVTVLGLALANQRRVSVRHILEFKENLRTLIISVLFLTLSGMIAPKDLWHALAPGLALLAFLVFVGRPASVFGALVRSKAISLKERTFLAFLAPRGIVAAAVTAVFALEFDAAAGNQLFGPECSQRIAGQTKDLVPLVFLIIVGTVLVYGLGATPLARSLGVATKSSSGVMFGGASPWVRKIARALQKNGFQVVLLDTNYTHVAAARMDGLEVYRANILSEFADEDLDINSIGAMIAATPNDEVNSIAVYRFGHHLGSAAVWQLAAGDHKTSHRNSVAGSIRGRVCFGGAPQYADLAALDEAGAQVKNVLITERYTYADFRRDNPDAVLLFIHDPKSGLLRPAGESPETVPAGNTIFAFVPRRENAGSEA